MFEVVVSQSAKEDIRGILHYLTVELRNRQAASNFADYVDSQITSLEEMPERYPFCREPLLASLGYRKIVSKSYVILCRIDQAREEVLISHVKHRLQDYERELRVSEW